MKRLILLSALIVCFTGAASAQDMPRADVFAGYSYVRFNPGFGAPGINTNGGSASASFHLNSWLGLVADFGGYHADEGFGSGTAYTYLFGPRVYLGHGRLVPFLSKTYMAESHIGGAASECDTVRVHEIPDSCSASQKRFRNEPRRRYRLERDGAHRHSRHPSRISPDALLSPTRKTTPAFRQALCFASKLGITAAVLPRGRRS